MESEENRKLWEQIEQETGVKYLDTFFTLFAIGDRDCETWWIMPDWDSIGKLRACKSFQEWVVKVHDEFLEPTKGLKRRIMTAGREHKVFG